MSHFQCPVCSHALFRKEKEYRCTQGHTFDLARQGHVNLLRPRDTGSGDPGDSREMLQSRQEFLNAGHYRIFSDKLNEIVLRDLPDPCTILDAGCGEGYYTWRLKRSLEAVKRKAEIYGVDVSKRAVQYAAGRDKGIRFAVASTYHLPVLAGSIDCLVCVFAPRDEGEFARVLKADGRLVVAAPGPRHLYSLRSIIYPDPPEIGQKGDVSGFALLDRNNVAYTIELDTRGLFNLLAMTPYSRHADVAALAKLQGLARLEVEVDINILVYDHFNK